MIRRLPVYFVIDVSSSMIGESIESVRNGLSMTINALRGEPQALETAYISVITFDSNARQLVPLTDLISFQEPRLNASGTTALGKALTLLSSKIDEEVKNGSAEEKGDWIPLCFLMTDGMPNDDWKRGLEEIKKRKIKIVACAAGFDADVDILRKITDAVVQLKTAGKNDIKAFFEWVTASVITQSQKIDSGSEGSGGGLNEMPPPPPELNVIV